MNSTDDKWISQTAAVYGIRRRTGAHWDICREKVAAMTKKTFKSREKVHTSEVDEAVRKLNAPPAKRDVKVKAVSTAQLSRIARA